MATFTVYNDSDAAALRPGQTIYPVRYRHIHRGVERLELRTRPARMNISHEPLVTGWLGTTGNVEATALGEYEVVDVKIRLLADGRERIDVKTR